MSRHARFSRLPGSARRYRDNETGQEISDRQRKKILEARGEIKRINIVLKHDLAKQRREYQKIVESRFRALQSQTGQTPSKRAIMADPELKAIVKNTKKQRRKISKIKRRMPGKPLSQMALTKEDIAILREHNEAMKRFLKFIGRRDGIPDWVPVGASAEFRAGKLRRTRLPAKWRIYT